MLGAKKINPALADFLKSAPHLLTILKEGDIVEGVLIEKDRKAAYFDLGPAGTGIVFGAEFINGRSILKKIQVGDKVAAKVVEPENEDGYVELSLADASKQQVWQKVNELKESGEIITAKILGANAGGLLTEVEGIRGFIPVSQLSSDHYPKVDDGDKSKIAEALKKLVGKELKLKVIDSNPRTNKLILSEREVATEDIKSLLQNYKVGDVVEVIVSGVADFGVFVKFTDNPKIDGMIHISELAHKIIENPKEIVKVDDVIKAKIIEIKDGRVYLSLKALQKDPWSDIDKKYKPGDTVKGTVARFHPFGALVNLEDGLQGIVHVSAFGSVEEMKNQLEEGKEYEFVIDSVKAENKRIILKRKR